MTDDLKKQIQDKQGAQGFIKVTDSPVSALTTEQKAVLNRKGNVFYNEGDIENARRIFVTTGYSDGLTRVGDTYMEKKEGIKALKQYFLAHNKKKSEPICEDLAKIVSIMLKED